MSDQNNAIIAIVTTKQESIKASGAPVFIAENNEELQKVSTSLEKILDASAHEINKDIMIIVAR